MSKIMHCWASRQARRQREDCPIGTPPEFNNYAMIKGRVVRYDFCTSKKRHSCGWDDMVYLGGGVWHHAEKIK